MEDACLLEAIICLDHKSNYYHPRKWKGLFFGEDTDRTANEDVGKIRIQSTRDATLEDAAVLVLLLC